MKKNDKEKSRNGFVVIVKLILAGVFIYMLIERPEQLQYIAMNLLSKISDYILHLISSVI